ncbi:MAG: phage holin family protein [bacterium]
MDIFINWLLSTSAIIVAAYLLPGITVDSFLAALVLAVVIGFINSVLKPLFLILTFPLTVFTLGLSAFIINAFLIWGASAVVPGFHVTNFWWALVFSIVLSLINTFFKKVQRASNNDYHKKTDIRL